MSGIVLSYGRVEVVVPAGGSIAVYTVGTANVYNKIQGVNQPASVSLLGTPGPGQTIFGPYTTGATIVVEAMASPVEYSIGVNPGCPSALKVLPQPNPGTLNATGALTAALITGGIVTSSTAAAVTATLPTGTVMDAALDLNIGDAFDWSAVNTGPNAFTVTQAASGHTVVGAGAVATVSSGRFRTRRTAAQTWITYRI